MIYSLEYVRGPEDSLQKRIDRTREITSITRRRATIFDSTLGKTTIEFTVGAEIFPEILEYIRGYDWVASFERTS